MNTDFKHELEKKQRGKIDLNRRIEELGPWFHNIRIDGIQTAPEHFLGDYPSCKFEKFAHVIPDDLEGRSVLDIGCNAGFYSIEMKRRNAGRVLGIDSDPHYLRQAQFAAEAAGVDIELRQLSVYEVDQIGEKFDLVIFMGVLYHLRHPLLALDLIRYHVADDRMLFQSLQRGSKKLPELEEDYPFTETSIFAKRDFPKLFFIEKRYSADPTNWFFPNKSAVEAMLRSSGFEIEANPEQEVYMCRNSANYVPPKAPPF